MKEFVINFPAFLLVLVRISSFFLMAPIFSFKTIPVTHKAGLGFFLSIIAFTTLNVPIVEVNELFFFSVMKECMIGILLGLVAFMILSAIQIAGGFIDFQMGFAIASVIDPQTGVQSPLTGQLYYTLALLLLITLDGHHMLIEGILNSFYILPLDATVHFGDENVVLFIIKLFSQMFIIAFQMAIPLVVCLFLVDLGLGILTRTVPQLNIFVVGLPLKIVVGFTITILTLPILFKLFTKLFEIVMYSMRTFLQLLGGA